MSMKKNKCPNCKGLGILFCEDGNEVKCPNCDDGYVVDLLKPKEGIINCKNEVLDILNRED